MRNRISERWYQQTMTLSNIGYFDRILKRREPIHLLINRELNSNGRWEMQASVSEWASYTGRKRADVVRFALAVQAGGGGNDFLRLDPFDEEKMHAGENIPLRFFSEDYKRAYSRIEKERARKTRSSGELSDNRPTIVRQSADDSPSENEHLSGLNGDCSAEIPRLDKIRNKIYHKGISYFDDALAENGSNAVSSMLQNPLPGETRFEP